MERKQRLVVAISGDTGFAYSVQALHASSAFSAPILVIVVNNGGSKSLELEAKGKSPGTGALPPRFAAFATKCNSLRCGPIAEGFGAVAFTLSDNEQLRSGIASAIDLVLGNNQLVVVDVKMDTSDDTWNDSWCVL
jgi:thiamine pyrophosphate-dependent acetolactate synthase large subunit-like protein